MSTKDNKTPVSKVNKSFEFSDTFEPCRLLESLSSNIIFSVDSNYRYTSFSETHKETMKNVFNADITIGTCILDLINGSADRQRAKSNLDRVLSGDQLNLCEEYGERNGVRLYWEIRYTPVKDSDGSITGVTVLVSDASFRIKREAELRDAKLSTEILKERELFLNSIGEGFYGVDLEGRCTFMNPAALEMLRLEPDDIIGKETHQIIHHHHFDGKPYEKKNCVIHRVISGRDRKEERTWLFRKDGTMFPVRIITSPVIKNGEFTGLVLAFSDISTQYEMEQQLKNANKELRMLATQDSLTGIYNRRYFEERGSSLVLSALNDSTPLSMIMFDIDLFKLINDRYGHSVGDLVLIMVTDTVQMHLRKNDIFARIGGEEFVILLPGIDHPTASDIAERIRQSVEEQAMTHENFRITCTISMGVAELAETAPDIYSLLKAADDRQYRAKGLGRNRVVS